MICPHTLNTEAGAFQTLACEMKCFQKAQGGGIFGHDPCEYTVQMQLHKGDGNNFCYGFSCKALMMEGMVELIADLTAGIRHTQNVMQTDRSDHAGRIVL